MAYKNKKYIFYKTEDEYRIHEILATKKYNSLWTYDEIQIKAGFSKEETRKILGILTKKHVVLLDYENDDSFKLKFLAPFEDEYDRYVSWYDKNLKLNKSFKVLHILALIGLPLVGYIWHWQIAIIYACIAVLLHFVLKKPMCSNFKADITHTFINDELKIIEYTFRYTFRNRLKVTDTDTQRVSLGDSSTILYISLPRKSYNEFTDKYIKYGTWQNADFSFNKKYCKISIYWGNYGIQFMQDHSFKVLTQPRNITYFDASNRRIYYKSDTIFHGDGCCVLLLPIISCIVTYFVS